MRLGGSGLISRMLATSFFALAFGEQLHHLAFGGRQDVVGWSVPFVLLDALGQISLEDRFCHPRGEEGFASGEGLHCLDKANSEGRAN
jgi:hypothetical protein